MHEYHVQVRVVGVNQRSGRDAAELELRPEDDAPGFVHMQNARLVLDANTWVLLSGSCAESGSSPSLPARSVEIARFPQRSLTALPQPAGFGLPFEWIALKSDMEAGPDRVQELRREGAAQDSGMRIVRSTLADPMRAGHDLIAIEANSSPGPDPIPYSAVRESWAAGDLWWRIFERRQQGHLTLCADTVEYIPAPKDGNGKRAVPESPSPP
jgi:hypothetical protein